MISHSMIALGLSAVQCLLLTTTIPHQNRRSPAFLRPFLQSPSFGMTTPAFSRTCTTRTRLLFSDFDKFIQPYGVSVENSTLSLYDEINHTELLDALLPRAYSKQDTIKNRARVYEAFQRTRLSEQLRLNRKSSLSKKQPDLNNIDNALMREMFQRARLAEQLRCEKNTKSSSLEHREHLGGLRSSSRITQHTNLMKNASNPLEMQLEQLHQLVELATRPSSALISLELINTNTASTHKNATIGTKTPLDILANTHLPLPPREDAPLLSLILAPMAHLVTSLFLMCASLFYVVMAALDVLCNDELAKSCLNQAGRVCSSCWDHLFAPNVENRHSAIRKITEVGKVSLSTSWYVAKCIVIRAKQSKYANYCMDAGTGCLRYAVYTIRSLDVLWGRVIDSYWKRENRINIIREAKLGQKQSKPKNVPNWKRKFHLYRVYSSVQNAISKRVHKQQCLKLEQHRLRLEREYQEKLSLLNHDRVAIERDRRAVHDAQVELEEERNRLLCESLNVLAWYLDAKARSASEAAEGEIPKKEGWGLDRWWKAWK